MKTESLREVKNNLSRVIDRLPETGAVVITRNGKAVAFLVSPDLRIVATSDPAKSEFSLMKNTENTFEGTRAAAIMNVTKATDDRGIQKFKVLSGNTVYGLILPVECLRKFGLKMVLVQEIGKDEAIGGIGGVILLVTFLISGFMALVFIISIIVIVIMY